MEKYIGVKLVSAKPMTRGEWLSLTRIDFPTLVQINEETANNEGYLVEYLGTANPNIQGYDNYVSWSPKDVFEQSYFGSGNLSFGLAFEAMRMGLTVSCPRLMKDGIKGLFMSGWEDTITAIHIDDSKESFLLPGSIFQYSNWEIIK